MQLGASAHSPFVQLYTAAGHAIIRQRRRIARGDMGNLTQFDRERLEAQALAQAAQNQPNNMIVLALREYSLQHSLDVSEGELFVIADLAHARQASLNSSAAAEARALHPRSLKDR